MKTICWFCRREIGNLPYCPYCREVDKIIDLQIQQHIEQRKEKERNPNLCDDNCHCEECESRFRSKYGW
jgi:hypothetical protein